MLTVICLRYSQPVWKMVSDAAQTIGKEIFTPSEIVSKVHETQPDAPRVSISTYVTAMAPNHPSSKFYPSTARLHGIFGYLGDGKFKLKDTAVTLDTKTTKPRSFAGDLGKDAFLEK